MSLQSEHAIVRRLLSPTTRDGIFFLALTAILLYITPSHTIFNAAEFLAQRMLAGHLDLGERVGWYEYFVRDGRFYIAYPPLTSVLVVPFVALPGLDLGQPQVAALLLAISALFLFGVFLSRAELRPFAHVAVIAYCFGTQLVQAVNSSTVWELMHLEANAALCAGLYFYFARSNAFAFGFFFSLAAMCRHSLAPACAIVLIFLMLEAWRKGRSPWRVGLQYSIGCAIPVAATLLLHIMMTGHPLATPYSVAWKSWSNQPKEIFHWRYVTANLYHYLWATPEITRHYPYLIFSNAGHSALFTSPFLALSMCAWWYRPAYTLCLAAAGATFIFYLFYHWNGYAQFGSRYLQDILPFLVVGAFAAASRSKVLTAITLFMVLVSLIVMSYSLSVYQGL